VRHIGTFEGMVDWIHLERTALIWVHQLRGGSLKTHVDSCSLWQKTFNAVIMSQLNESKVILLVAGKNY
jgi:hypothetical protein